MSTRIEWIEKFPRLAILPPEIKEKLSQESGTFTLKEGACVFAAGKPAEHFLLLVSGQVRVQQISHTGREIVLYRVRAGESCALTTACLLGGEDYIAEAIVEENATAIAIPKDLFDGLITGSKDFRTFVFTAFNKSVSNLFRVIDEVAFSRIDIRLAHKLIELADGQDKVVRTHQQLASELGTAREVISRQLLEFQRRGLVKSARGQISLIDSRALHQLAGID